MAPWTSLRHRVRVPHPVVPTRRRPAPSWGPRAVLASLLDLALPAECAGCAAPGPPLCRSCLAAFESERLPGAPCLVARSPQPAGLPPLLSTFRYAGAVATALRAYKDAGRRDLVRSLAPALAPALVLALQMAPHDPPSRRSGVWVVPAPSSRAAGRTRGDRPLEHLARAALEVSATSYPLPQATVVSAVESVRRVADQSSLGHEARAVNVAFAYSVRPALRSSMRGQVCLLVDDVVTTGATLADAARALRHAGAVVPGAATVAATVLRREPLTGRGHDATTTSA